MKELSLTQNLLCRGYRIIFVWIIYVCIYTCIINYWINVCSHLVDGSWSRWCSIRWIRSQETDYRNSLRPCKYLSQSFSMPFEFRVIAYLESHSTMFLCFLTTVGIREWSNGWQSSNPGLATVIPSLDIFLVYNCWLL